MKSLLIAISLCPVYAAVNTQAQQDVDIQRYCGRWYEQARYENWFEEGMENVYTDYILLSNGSIQITNHGTTAQGYPEQASGRAFVTAPGVLAVSFVWPYWWFRTPYKILFIDAEYRAALVSGEDGSLLWLLTRETQPSRHLIQLLLNQAHERGFDTSKLRYTQHQNLKSTAPETNTPG